MIQAVKQKSAFNPVMRPPNAVSEGSAPTGSHGNTVQGKLLLLFCHTKSFNTRHTTRHTVKLQLCINGLYCIHGLSYPETSCCLSLKKKREGQTWNQLVIHSHLSQNVSAAGDLSPTGDDPQLSSHLYSVRSSSFCLLPLLCFLPLQNIGCKIGSFRVALNLIMKVRLLQFQVALI